MLPRERAEKILTLHAAGWPVQAIADHIGHSHQTIRDYINGRRTPGIRAPRPSLLTDPLASYCRQRLAEDPHLRTSVLFKEVADLGFQGSRATLYRELKRRHRLLIPADRQETNSQEEPPQVPPGMSRTLARRHERTPVLPQPVAPIAGETLNSYLARIAQANHLTVTEILAVLPTWFSTKANNLDDRAQHHMLAPAAAQALHELAHLTSTTPVGLAHALPAFGTDESPVRAMTACHRCTARLGICEPVPVHLPIHHKVCTRHGIWLSDLGEPHLDLITAEQAMKAAEDAKAAAEEAAEQAMTELDEAKTRFEAEVERIREEAAREVEEARQQREQQEAAAAERIRQVEAAADDRVADAEAQAGREQNEAARQVEEMKATVGREQKAAAQVKADAVREVEDARTSVREAEDRVRTAEESARQAARDAEVRVSAVEKNAAQLREELHTELQRARGDAERANARLSTLETRVDELRDKLDEAREKIRDAEDRARTAEEAARQARGKK